MFRSKFLKVIWYFDHEVTNPNNFMPFELDNAKLQMVHWKGPKIKFLFHFVRKCRNTIRKRYFYFILIIFQIYYLHELYLIKALFITIEM